ncbi:hypothetical protein LEN26_000421 [Aphanomyces euteiches]|nr:hypothetical protein AeMF1_003088 [Aphanomyces euteiches]KAH9163610.1 hypothetical protein LEN26_000421 [Aphanomyces euteiches]
MNSTSCRVEAPPLRARKRMSKVAPEENFIHTTLHKWSQVLDQATSSSPNHVDALYNQFINKTELPQRTQTAIALDIVAQTLHRVLPTMPIADAVMDTLLNAVYVDFDPEMNPLDHAMYVEVPSPPPPKLLSSVGLEDMAKQWNELVLQRLPHKCSKTEAAAVLATCLDVLPTEIQGQLGQVLANKLEFAQQSAKKDTEVCDSNDAAFDPGEESDREPIESNQDHFVQELRQVYHLLSINNPRAKRSARKRINTLLSAIDPQDEQIDDEDSSDHDELMRLATHFAEHDPGWLVNAGLF